MPVVEVSNKVDLLYPGTSRSSSVVCCANLRRSDLTPFKASEGLDGFLPGHVRSEHNRNLGPFHHRLLSAISETCPVVCSM